MERQQDRDHRARRQWGQAGEGRVGSADKEGRELREGAEPEEGNHQLHPASEQGKDNKGKEIPET